MKSKPSLFILDRNETDVLEVFGPYLGSKVQMHVLFLGSNPSTQSPDPRVPFAGTRSGRILTSWIELLGANHRYQLMNLSEQVTENNRPLLKGEVLYDTLARRLQGDFFAIVALGDSASKALRRLRRDHFRLPHPSPLNRQLNDRRFVLQALRDCRLWLEKQKAPDS